MTRAPRQPRRSLNPTRGLLMAFLGLLCAGQPGVLGGAAAVQDGRGLDEIVAESRTLIHRVDGDLTGPGLELLIDEGHEAELFLIGESHSTAEIPELTARLAAELRPAGYAALAVETGPLSTRWMVEAVRSGGPARLAEIIAQYPFTLPFFEGRPEVAMLEVALEEGYEIWGLDQEFMGSGRYWLDRLAALAPDDEARALVADWQRREADAARHFQETGSSERAFLLNATPETFANLRTAFRDVPEALETIHALATSSRIYRLWRPRNYENNRQRVAYMKANLVARLEEMGGALSPKLLMKFGSVHMGRGLSPVSQYDLGNLAHELAVLRGGRSVHLQATGLGLRASDGRFSDWTSGNPDWRPLFDRVDPDAAWTVFDLRVLRPWFHRQGNREAHPGLARTVFRYDLLTISPELHRAPPLVTQPDEAGP